MRHVGNRLSSLRGIVRSQSQCSLQQKRRFESHVQVSYPSVISRGLSSYAGTVKPYNEHILVFTGHSGAACRAKHDSNAELPIPLLRALSTALKKCEHDPLVGKVKLSSVSGSTPYKECAPPEPKESWTEKDRMDETREWPLLVVQQRLWVKNATVALAPELVSWLLDVMRAKSASSHVKNSKERATTQPSWGQFVNKYGFEQLVLVCEDKACSERCGEVGRSVRSLLEKELSTGAGEVRVMGVSSLGCGCVNDATCMAATVVAYPGGHWYGGVGPADVLNLAVTHWKLSELEPRHWRGRMGMTAAEQIRFFQTSSYFMPQRWD